MPSVQRDEATDIEKSKKFQSKQTSDAPKIYVPQPGMREIGSASVELLSSENLLDLRDMIVAARQQQVEVKSDIRDTENVLGERRAALKKRKNSIFKMFLKRRIAELEEEIPQIEIELDELSQWSDATHIDLSFDTTEAAKKAYATLVRSFTVMRSSDKIWDLTADRETDRFRERTAAQRTIDRHRVELKLDRDELIRFEGTALRFGNVNGEDILIYPGVACVPRADGVFALIDLRELQLKFSFVSFHEVEQVPSDAKVTGETWAKANKDGSPDLRFRDNYSIPICQYGLLLFETEKGLSEEYMVSNANAAEAFANSFLNYKNSLLS